MLLSALLPGAGPENPVNLMRANTSAPHSGTVRG